MVAMETTTFMKILISILDEYPKFNYDQIKEENVRDLSIFIRIWGRKNSIRDSKFFSYRKTGTERIFENLKWDNNFFNR